MKTKTVITTALLLCGAVSATEFNLANDFSTSNNPSATWTYGWFHNTIPGGSSLEAMTWNGSAWSETNGISIWKNDTTSSIGNVAPGQVALNPLFDKPAVIRWTAPAAIGLASIQIDGEFAPGITGLEIRRSAGVVLSVTNSTTFSAKLMVEPGDKIDFVTAGEGTKPLTLTITSVAEELLLHTFDDFNHSYMHSWSGLPVYQPLETFPEGSSNYYARADDTGTSWGAGMYQNMPFTVSTNLGYSTISHFSRIAGNPYGTDYAGSGIKLTTDAISTNQNINAFTYAIHYYEAENNNTPYLYTVDAEGTKFVSGTTVPLNQWIEIRADIDWSYKDAQGTYGLCSLFMRLGPGQWYAVPDRQLVEMKIPDPETVTKLCALAPVNDHSSGYIGHVDDIRYSSGQPPNLGVGQNLLINGSIDKYQLGWRNDAANHRSLYYFQGFIELSTPAGITGCVNQVVSLQEQGLSAADIDAGLYRAAFGGSLHHDGGDAFSGPYDGRVSIDFLNEFQQPISSADAPEYVYEYLKGWETLMATNPVPAQTRFIRYNYNTQGGLLNNAYLSILGIPQEDKALTVASIHGSPTPAVGTSSNSWGTVIDCSVAHVNAGTTQYECIGWTGTGSVPASGTSNSVEVTLTDDSSIIWNWGTNYLLDITISGNGSVDADDAFYVKGSEQILTATPDSGWLFMGWSGDASGTNEAIVIMDGPQAVTATFSDDADDDGLTNAEEAALGSNPWKKDTDNDGFGDKLEADHNWNPTVSDQWAVDYIANNGSAFGLYTSNAVLDVAVGQMVIETAGGAATLSLQLEESADLGSWTNAGEAVEWSWPVDGEKKFFRVRAEP